MTRGFDLGAIAAVEFRDAPRADRGMLASTGGRVRIRSSTVRRSRWIFAAIAFGAFACGDDEPPAVPSAAAPASASEAPAPPANLATLRAQVGMYPSDIHLFDTDPLRSRLLALLGTRYTTFLANFGTQGPLSAEGDVLYAIGNKPHAGGDSQAILLIDLSRDLIHVRILDELEMAEYRERDEEIPLPPDVETTISNWEELARDVE
jgi:hypothetical protein